MLTLQTAHFGLVEYAEGTEIEFPSGLPAFENERTFVFLRRPGYEPLLFLQSVSTPHLAFLGIAIQNIRLDYEVDLSEEEASLLGGPAPASEFDLFALIAVSSEGAVSANLQAPLVIHRERRLAIQVIQTNPAYSCHYPLGTDTAPSQETPCL